MINGDIDRGVKTKLFLHDSDGELLHTKTGADLDYKATKTDTFYIAVGATTGQSTGTKFRPNGVPYGYDIKLIQKRAPKTLPSASWLSSLNVISSDISDAVISGSSDGKLDRSELISILDKVKVNGITEAELTDLRILVANYKELGLTNYLVTILDNLVNGDPANQYYTGRKDSNLGNTSRENIGNLYPEVQREEFKDSSISGLRVSIAPQHLNYMFILIYLYSSIKHELQMLIRAVWVTVTYYPL